VDRFLNALKGHAAAMDRAAGQPRFALVASVDPARYAARVTLQPEGVLTGWLPVLSSWIGNGWGMTCLPSPGDQVFVLPQEGNAEHGVVVGSSFSDAARPPGAAPGEFWLLHRSGTSVRLTNDGIVHITGPVEIAGNVQIAGNLLVQGQIQSTGDMLDSHRALSQLRAHYNMHTHQDPQGGTTSVPNPQD
jgi:phage baseplate assembly protein gpV